jgi:hypothetical protein
MLKCWLCHAVSCYRFCSYCASWFSFCLDFDHFIHRPSNYFIILFVKLSFHFFYFFTFKLVVDLVISIYASMQQKRKQTKIGNQILSFIILANRRSLILTNWGKDSIGCVLLTNKKKKNKKQMRVTLRSFQYYVPAWFRSWGEWDLGISQELPSYLQW